jgi:hypothetical protein
MLGGLDGIEFPAIPPPIKLIIPSPHPNSDQIVLIKRCIVTKT